MSVVIDLAISKMSNENREYFLHHCICCIGCCIGSWSILFDCLAKYLYWVSGGNIIFGLFLAFSKNLYFGSSHLNGLLDCTVWCIRGNVISNSWVKKICGWAAWLWRSLSVGVMYYWTSICGEIAIEACMLTSGAHSTIAMICNWGLYLYMLGVWTTPGGWSSVLYSHQVFEVSTAFFFSNTWVTLVAIRPSKIIIQRYEFSYTLYLQSPEFISFPFENSI
jgi:hypothetical protein